jgi:hypothetical protein
VQRREEGFLPVSGTETVRLLRRGVERRGKERFLPVSSRDLGSLSHFEDLDLENRCQLGLQAVCTAFQLPDPAVKESQLFVEMREERLMSFAVLPDLVSQSLTTLA